MLRKELERLYLGKKVLVTGGAGFIGSHLVEMLVTLGCRVTVLDNLSTGSLDNLRSVITRIRFMYADVTSASSMLVATINQDIVFHLAAMVSVPESLAFPERCYETNSKGTENILNGCRKNKVGVMILASSSSVYGNKNQICREYDQVAPETPYAISKLQAEQFCRNYSQMYGINTACLRYFNVYGERQRDEGSYAGVVAKFKKQLLNELPLVIYGDGKQTRDFIQVDAVVQATIQMPLFLPLMGDIFNIASGTSITLLQLIKKLEIALNKSAQKLIFEPERSGDISHSQADCTKYRELLAQFLNELSYRFDSNNCPNEKKMVLSEP